MSVEKPNDKEMLWVLTLFIDGVLSHETIQNRYLKDSEEKDKVTDSHKFELIKNACAFLVQNDFAEEGKNETGSHITVLNENCLEFYRRIKGREDRRQNARLPKKKVAGITDFINSISSNTIVAATILIIIGILGYVIYLVGSE